MVTSAPPLGSQEILPDMFLGSKMEFIINSLGKAGRWRLQAWGPEFDHCESSKG